MSSPSDIPGARRAADACGARPGTPEAAGSCDDLGDAPPSATWEFWSLVVFDIMPGFWATGSEKP